MARTARRSWLAFAVALALFEAPRLARAASGEGDVVESIDESAPAPAPEQARDPRAPDPRAPDPRAPDRRAPETNALEPTKVAPMAGAAELDSDRFELHGWARQSLELGLARRSPQSNDATAVPYQQLTARSQMFMRARYSRARWFEANVSGSLSYSLFEEEPSRPATDFNGFNGKTARGALEPELHELYVGFFTPHLDIRIGQQRVAWGNSDFRSPNDVVNARDTRDPFVSETELRMLPTFMLRADLDLGIGTLQALVSPAYTPDRYDVYGSNWAAVQPDAPIWARGVSNIARRSLDPTLQESAQRLLMATRLPKSNFSEPVVGARFSWSASGVDLNYYYQYGFDGPFVTLDPAFAESLAKIDFSQAGLVDLEPWLAAIDAGHPPLQVSFVRRHHIGLDIGTTIGPLSVRLDAAYESKRVFFRRDLTSALSPSIEGVLSLEYQTGDKDKVLILEGLYLRVVDVPPAPLLVYERDTVGLAADVRWPLWRALGFEARALAGLKPRTITMQPQLNIKFDPWVVSIGGLYLNGEAFSLGQHFHRNEEVYTKLKLLF